MSDLSQRVAALSPERRELLKRKLLDNRTGANAIRPREETGPAPLAYSQQLMWLLNQLVAEPGMYNSYVFLRLKGELNVPALHRTLNALLERHPTFRTNIIAPDGVPHQIVRDFQPAALPIVDVSPGPEQEAEVERLCRDEALRTFDLAQDLLFRTTLFRLNPRDHVLLLITHHMAFDAWSRRILHRELAQLYRAFCDGNENPLAPLPLQYTDFAAWQREAEQNEAVRSQLAYWKRRLEGAPQVLELPADRPRPAVQRFRGAKLPGSRIGPLLEGLKPFMNSERVTLFMTCLAAFNVLLSRYTGRDDILVGVPILGRHRPEVEPLIGYFANTMIVRTDLSGDPSFRELARRVRASVLEGFDHQDVPLEMLTAELQPERDSSRSPLFQVLFTLGEQQLPPPDLPGIEVSVKWMDRGVSRLDMSLGIAVDATQTSLALEYNTDIFDADRMARAIGHFENLLESVAADPDVPISQLEMLTESERRQLILDWNKPTAEYPADATLHGRIERQAARTPDLPAIVSENETLSYAQLNARANRLAHDLMRRGVGPECKVGLCVKRSPQMIVGLLGVLKAGGAVVPLDISDPPQRLASIVADAGLSLVLTGEGLEARIREAGATPIGVEAGGEEIGNPMSGVAPGNLAYVIYTSGSTGQPRGVLLTHRGLANHQHFAADYYGLGPGDRVLQSSPVSFDISIEEIFPALASGAAVVLRPDNVDVGGRHFLNWIARRRITVLDLPTAFWHEWTRELAALKQKLPADLRLVIVGGEKAQAGALLEWKKTAGERVRWVNTYGPTEASVIVTAYNPGGAPLDPATNIPIGRPVANARLYILDRHLKPVPIGIPGELYIGGDGVARGYLNQPELTAERFLSDPFGADEPARLFKTGDAARYRSDGNIEFLGRIDQQVKVRGYRVEPGEIETALAKHPGVSEVAVLDRATDSGGVRLVAYVVSKPGAAPEAGELRRFLRDRLPEYSIPSAFVLLPAFPKTSRGKLDRDALPAPDISRDSAGQAFVPPRGEVEVQLAKIWEKVLGVQPIGAKDNFFELGGHSLLAVGLFLQIEKAFGKSLPLATLFEAQTVEQLASVIGTGGGESRWSSLVPIQTAGDHPPLFCVHAQSGNVLFYRELAQRLGARQPFYAFRSVGLDGAHPPLTRVEDMASHYLKELREVQPEGPYYLAGFCLGAYIALEMARQLQLNQERVAFLGVFDTSGEWRMVHSFLGGLQYHRKRMSGMSLPQTPRYLAARIWYRIGRLKHTLVAWLVESFREFPQTFPRRLRDMCIFQLNIRANHAYEPAEWDGRITYFHGKNGLPQYPAALWREIAAQGVEVHIVPGAGVQLFREPNVGFLADALQAALKRAREAPVSRCAAISSDRA